MSTLAAARDFLKTWDSRPPEQFLPAWPDVVESINALRAAVEEAEKHPDPEIVIYVEGGIVRGATATVPIAVVIFDADDKMDENEYTRDQVEAEYKQLTEGMKPVY